MSDIDTAPLPPQIEAMNRARIAALARAAAHDPEKLRKAKNIVRAALEEKTLTLGELTDGLEVAA